MSPAKRLLPVTLVMFQSLATMAQGEFHINNNGLIYADSTIAQLKYIVDSLNLKFKTCDFNKTYYSLPQTTANYFSLEGYDARLAKEDIINNISFEELIKKYPKGNLHKNLLLTRDEYLHNEKPIVTYSGILLGTATHQSFAANTGSGKWIYNYRKRKSNFLDEFIEAFYLIEPLRSTVLLPQYSKLIQYADCLIDTTATIYTSQAYRDYRDYKKKNKLDFFTYLAKYTGDPPKYPKNDNGWDQYERHYRKWLHQKDSIVNILAKTEAFKTSLSSSFKIAHENGGSNEEFESYVEQYISPSAALELKRGRIVVGGCSQDTRPRTHAFDIARLSASAVKWEVFLRAHLDIMNDRFERSSDGSYAWARRETYIRELEVLDINLADLLAGIVLRVADASPQHYYGNVSRIGRALAEAQDRENITKSLLTIISDRQLDPFNRTLFLYLFLHYTVNLQIERERNENMAGIQTAVQTLPPHMIEQAMLTIAKFRNCEK